MTNLASAFVLSDVWGLHHDDVGVGWGLVMMLVMVLFWGLVIYGVVVLIRGGLRSGADRSADPREVLNRRLAAGEISVEEYEQRKALIEGESSPPQAPGTPAPGGSG